MALFVVGCRNQVLEQRARRRVPACKGVKHRVGYMRRLDSPKNINNTERVPRTLGACTLERG